MLPRSLQLVGGDNRLSPALPPTCGGSGQPGLGALADQVALELAQRAEDVEDEPSARRGGVDAFGQRPEADATRFQRGDCLDEVWHRAPEPIQTPDGQHVAGAQVGQRISQAGPEGLQVASLLAERCTRRCAARTRLRRRLQPALAAALDRVFVCLDAGDGIAIL